MDFLAVVLLFQFGIADVWGLTLPDVDRMFPISDRTTIARTGGESAGNSASDDFIVLRGDDSAQWLPPHDAIESGGTFNMWVRPQGPDWNLHSHALATFRWTGGDGSYFALSHGWWEPQGERKLHFILSNQQHLGCIVPWKFDYKFFGEQQWTMVTAVWHSGSPGFVRLFVDGRRVCESHANFADDRRLSGPIFIGTDKGAPIENRGRIADMDVKGVELRSWAVRDEEIRRFFLTGGGSARNKWIAALLDEGTLRGSAGERRWLFDEDTAWASSPFEIERRLTRIREAGFNIYAPCVWDGAHAYFQSGVAPVAPSIKPYGKTIFDPLRYLITRAHAAGIEVHPWFVVVRRAPGSTLPAAFSAGASAEAYNVHNFQFRDFIVATVLDAAKRYDIDGINLDYIRAIDPCTDPECSDAYRGRFNRSLSADWLAARTGAVVPALIEWNRSAVTDVVRRVANGARAIKRNLIVSVDSVPYDHERQLQGVDELGWLHSNLIDAVVAMEYDDPIDVDGIDRAIQGLSAPRMLIAIRDFEYLDERVADRSGSTMTDYVHLIRSRWPGAGIAIYHYPHLSADQVMALKQGAFATSTLPAWKE